MGDFLPQWNCQWFLKEPLWSFEGITTAITNCLSSKFCSVNGDRNVQLTFCNENIFFVASFLKSKNTPSPFSDLRDSAYYTAAPGDAV